MLYGARARRSLGRGFQRALAPGARTWTERGRTGLRAQSKGPEPQGVTSWYPSGETVVGLGFAHRTLLGALKDSPPADVIVEEVE